MKANELRIGNWYINDCDDLPIKLDNENIITAIKDEDWLLPIPLTEEWLLKFGFEKHKNNYEEAESHNYYLNGLKYISCDDNWCLFNCLIKNIEYVHQLQNLTFALTNEELTIKTD